MQASINFCFCFSRSVKHLGELEVAAVITLPHDERVTVSERKGRLNAVVSADPEIMHGVPCFRGTRVPVQLLLDDLRSGYTIDQFLEGCPTVSREQVETYLELAQALVSECVS